MEVFVIVALIGFGLLLAELLLPTGGVLAAIGIGGLIAGGVIALGSDSDAADYIGPALITFGVISAVVFYFVTRKVIEAHRDQPVRTGAEELVGAEGDARTEIDPEGQVWLQGTIWGARLADPATPVRRGDRVRVEELDGLTLVVRPVPSQSVESREGVG